MNEMARHWKEILPIDQYQAACSGLLHAYDRKTLTLLYQPLIGPVAFSLYMTLWAQIEENRLWSHEYSHHDLMNFLDLNLKDIYDARLKLEGMGLLKTFVQQKDEIRFFIYELQPPLSPKQFFLDGMLNIYLYRKIGRRQFLKLKKFFSDAAIPKNEGFEDITRNFQDVFESAIPSHFQLTGELAQDLGEFENETFIGRVEGEGIQVDPFHFDFDLLFAGLSEALVPRKAMTKKVREAISKLSYLYGIDPIQMKNIVMGAVDENNEINIEELRKAARDWYQLERSDQFPMLVDKRQPVTKKSNVETPKTKEEQLIHYLDNTSPRQVLIDISGGAEPAKGDLQIIEDVMFNQKLLPGVVNVLIHYVMLKTDMKLVKGYVDKIASHWARKKITTVKDAMELAKKEHRQYAEWAENKKYASGKAGKKPIRKEALPDWFYEDDDDIEEVENSPEYERKKREIEEKLKKYKS